MTPAGTILFNTVIRKLYPNVSVNITHCISLSSPQQHLFTMLCMAIRADVLCLLLPYPGPVGPGASSATYTHNAGHDIPSSRIVHLVPARELPRKGLGLVSI
jgi:hypothetical protein